MSMFDGFLPYIVFIDGLEMCISTMGNDLSMMRASCSDGE